ncbi:hypothetical protein ABMA70_13375 [Halobacteriovorax sp. XZX-3]|uniref:hypothetical protein n=1 Tax=unclassified Halobacteriovorax TaxID=2639665 RepID=UPI00371C83A9
MNHRNLKFSILSLISLSSFANCPALTGTWEGLCDRDGSVKVEKLYIKQESCEHINFYGMDYKIGKPYSEQYENKYEKTFNVHNLYWGRDGQSLYFNVDRVQWMKDRNQTSNAQGVGFLKVDGEEMSYSRIYSGRSRDGQYFKKTRMCNFTRI